MPPWLGSPVAAKANQARCICVGERLHRRALAGEDLHDGQTHRPEHEGQLERVARAEHPAERRGLPIEEIHVGRGAARARAQRPAAGWASGRPRRSRWRPRCHWAPPTPPGTRRAAPVGVHHLGRRTCRARRWPPIASRRRRRAPSARDCRGRRASARPGWCRSTGRLPSAEPLATAASGCSGNNDAVDDREERQRDHPGIGAAPAHLLGGGDELGRPGPAPATSLVHEATPQHGRQPLGRIAPPPRRVCTCTPPLCTMARRKSPSAAGVPSSVGDAEPPGRLAEDRHVAPGRRRRPRCCRAPSASAASWSCRPQFPTSPSGSARSR